MEDPLADVLSQVVMQESAGGDIDEVGCIDVLGDVGTTVPALGFYLAISSKVNPLNKFFMGDRAPKKYALPSPTAVNLKASARSLPHRKAIARQN